VVDVTYFNRFDLELIVLTLADDDTLLVLLYFLIVILRELVSETHA